MKNGKRLIPVVIGDVIAEAVFQTCGTLNWVFLRERDDFDTGFAKLLKAIKTDYDWVQAHRRLQVKALEWKRREFENSFLLGRGSMRDAEAQTAANAMKEPYLTDLQRDYLLKSRQVSDRQRWIVIAAASAGFLASGGWGFCCWLRPFQLRTLARGELVPITAGPVVSGTNDPEHRLRKRRSGARSCLGSRSTAMKFRTTNMDCVCRRAFAERTIQPACETASMQMTPSPASRPIRQMCTAAGTASACRPSCNGNTLPRGRMEVPGHGATLPPSPETANLTFDDEAEGEAEGELMRVNSLPAGASREGV